MINWFRVPVGIARALDGSVVATREQAIADLLGRWHMGAPANDRELRKAWKWSHDRVAKLVAEMTTWAEENGAAGPKSPAVDPRDREIEKLRARLAEMEAAAKGPTKIDHGPTSDRPATDHAEPDATPVSDASPTTDRPRTDQPPTTTRAGSPQERDGRSIEEGGSAHDPSPPTTETPCASAPTASPCSSPVLEPTHPPPSPDPGSPSRNPSPSAPAIPSTAARAADAAPAARDSGPKAAGEPAPATRIPTPATSNPDGPRPARVDGRELPRDLPGFFGELQPMGGGRALLPWLTGMGVLCTADLLEMPASKWKYVGLRDVKAADAVVAAIRRQGLEPGCMAVPETPEPKARGAPPGPAPPRRTQADRRSAGLAVLAAARANLASSPPSDDTPPPRRLIPTGEPS